MHLDNKKWEQEQTKMKMPERNHLAGVESFFCLFNLPQDLLITQLH